MGNKWVLGMISVIAVAAIAGVGFATYNATASVTVTGNAGSFFVVATGTLTGSSLAVGTCTASASGSAITLVANNLLPGDYCTWNATFTDPGSIGGNFVSWTPFIFSGPGCTELSNGGFWTSGPSISLLPGSGNFASFVQTVSDTGAGLVSGSCSGTLSATWAAA
jgi:hypothetical protein